MKRTHLATLLIALVGGFVLSMLAQMALASAGKAGIIPPITFAIVVAAIGAIVVALAVPIRRAVKGTSGKRVDSFYALRVLVLAKSSAIAGALLSGIGAGLVVYLLTRTVPALGSIGYSIAMTIGAVILLSGGLIAESMCRIPPVDPDKDEKAAAGALP